MKKGSITVGMFHYKLIVAPLEETRSRCNRCAAHNGSILCSQFQKELKKSGVKGCHVLPCFFKTIHM